MQKSIINILVVVGAVILIAMVSLQPIWRTGKLYGLTFWEFVKAHTIRIDESDKEAAGG